MTYQRAYFPMKYVKITQGYGSGTHKYSYALDLAGKDTGKDEVYAPFDCKVTKLYQPSDRKKAPEVWLTSTKKVLCSNGYYGYLTISLTHSTDVYNMRLGQVFLQGQVVCHEGNQGVSSGNHIHLELSTGTTAGWDKNISNKYGAYVNVNKVKPEDYLFLKEDAKVLQETKNGKTYHFKKESELTYKVKGTDGSLTMRKTPKVALLNKIKTIKEGSEVIRFYSKNGWAYIYNYGNLGYVVDRYLKK